MWDGIENAGCGVHDYDDSYWVNLTTGIRCSCSGVVKYRNYVSFGADGVESILRSGFDIKNYGTIEILISKHNLGKDVNKCSIVGGPSRYDGYGICDNNGVIVDTKDDEGGRGIRLVLDVTTLYTYTKNTNASTREIFKNGSLDDGVFAAVDRRFGRAQGNAIASGAYGSIASYFDAYSVRIYSHVFTPDEISANYAVDKARFNLP